MAEKKEFQMQLTEEEQDIFGGKQGDIRARALKTLVMYGEAFGAKQMVPVTGRMGHSVVATGSMTWKPVFDLYQKILDAGVKSRQPFTTDPRPYDPNIPSSLLHKLASKHIIFGSQRRLDRQLKALGLSNATDYTCTCYLEEVGNIPKRGDVLSWAESSAVVYANSVLGARCNRNSGLIEMMGSILGRVPEFGFITDDGRKADWIVEIRTKKIPEAQVLGSAIGMKVIDKVPYIKGLDRWIGTQMNDQARTYLKDFGAATASNGAVGLYHIENLTPEAVENGEDLIRADAPVYIIDDAELKRVRDSYPCIWKHPDRDPQLCFVGCPHMSLQQLKDWTDRVEGALGASGNVAVRINTVFLAAPAVIRAFQKTSYAARLKKTGVIVSAICPLGYTGNPLSRGVNVITCSNKLRTYSAARFHTEEEVLKIITRKGR